MSNSVTRRGFLGSAATASVAMSVAGSRAYGSIPGANDKVVVAVIGTGSRGTELSKVFAGRPGVEIAYVCDVDKRRVEKAAATVIKANDKRTPKKVEDFRTVLQDKA